MAGQGGARPGAGRKPKAEKHKGKITAAEKQIADRLPDLIENLFRLAEGVEVQKTDPNGRERIYSQPPDRQANEYLLNRIMGKPTERVEQDTEQRSEVVIRYVNNWRDIQTLPTPESGAEGGVGDRP